MDTQQVMQDAALDRLAKRCLTVLPLNQYSSWTCPHCGNEVEPVEWNGALYRNPICGCKGSYEVKQKNDVPHDKRVAMIKTAGITQKRIDMFGLDKFDHALSKSSNSRAALKSIADYCNIAPTNKGDVVWLHGYYGTGKTRLAVGAMMRLIYRNVMTGYFANFLSINIELQSNSATMEHYLDLMCKCQVLVIDDIDKESPGRNASKLLLATLSYREERYNKVTILTSNRAPGEFIKYFQSSSDAGIDDKSIATVRRISDELALNMPLVYKTEVRHG